MKESQKLDLILKALIDDFHEDSIHDSVSFYNIYERFNGNFWRRGMSYCVDKLKNDGLIVCTTIQKRQFSDNKDDYDYFITITDKASDFINEGGYTQKEKVEREQQELLNERTRLEIGNAKRLSALMEQQEAKPMPQQVVFQKANGTNPLVDLHVEVQKTADDLFRNGHFRQAIIDVFIALELAVKHKSGIKSTGVSLMQTVFSQKTPILHVVTDTNEQRGYMDLFAGAFGAIRNHYAHNTTKLDDPKQALEILSFASFLWRTLDASSINYVNSIDR